MKFNRITVNPMQIGCVLCLRGIRIPVATVIDKKEFQDIIPESFSVEERMSVLNDLVGIVHSENPNFAEKLAKEERLARQ